MRAEFYIAFSYRIVQDLIHPDFVLSIISQAYG